MNKKRNIAFLRAELARLDRLITNTDEGDWLTLPGLVGRRDQAARELEQVLKSAERDTAQDLTFTFDGAPTTSRSIEPNFLGHALIATDKLVLESLKSQSAFPSRVKESGLHFAREATGSFGFTLEEVGQRSLLKTPLGDAIQSVRGLLEEAASLSPEAWASRVAELDPSVVTRLRNLIRLIDRGKASLSMRGSGFPPLRLNRLEVQKARETVDEVEVEETESVDRVFLYGWFPPERKFAAIRGGESIVGKIDLRPPEGWSHELPTLEELSRLFPLNTMVVASLTRTVTTYHDKASKKWTLRWLELADEQG